MTMVDGVTYTGYGRTNFNQINLIQQIFGVPAQDAAPDNVTLTGTNVITFASGRRSGVQGRRNAIVSGDTIGQFNFNGQTAANGVGLGLVGAQIIASAVENFGAGARGSQIAFNTVNTGTTTISTRLTLRDRDSIYSSDTHRFTDKTGSFTAVSVTTATATFTAIPVMPTFTAAGKPISGAVGQMICISNSTPGGRMAYWDTTNARWSYVADDSAV
jgi:hypothetical protein